MEFLQRFWDAVVELDPEAAALDEGVRFPLCRPEAPERLFAAARLEDIAVSPLDIPTRFTSFDDWWQPFLGGQGPAPAYVLSLMPPARPVGALKAELPPGLGQGDGPWRPRVTWLFSFP